MIKAALLAAGLSFFVADKPVTVRGFVLCDRQDQIESILVAQQFSWEAGVAAYRNWFNTPNADGFASCAFIDIPFDIKPKRRVAFFEGVNFPDSTFDIYVIEVEFLFDYENDIWTTGYIASEFDIVDPGDPA